MSALALDLAWKSAVVAALVLAVVALLRSRAAAERVTLLRLGVVVVFALPLFTALAPALRIEAPALARIEPAPATVPGPTPDATTRPGPNPTTGPIPGLPADASPPPTRAVSLPHISPSTLLAGVWLAGVAALILRLLGGVATLALWTRRAEPVNDPLWRAALDRVVTDGRRPRLKVSSRIASPLSWGWPHGVILIDEATLSRPDRADAVLAHEMGHIRRHDWLFLMLSHALVAVLWFNPIVWRLRTELARQSEQAADAWAVRHVHRLDYAGALVAMARCARPVAALGMAGPSSDLARRVAAVLDGSRGKSRPWSTAAAAVVCLGMAGPLAALEWTPGAPPAPDAPTPRSVPTTAAAVAALLPETLTAADVPPPAKTLSPDALAALVRQRDRGLVMFEAGARALEAGAAQIHRQRQLVSNPEQREEMLQEAENLAREAADLRAQARRLAARDPATLTPMSEAEEREMEMQMQNLLALPMQMQIGMTMEPGVSTDVQVDTQVGFVPPPPIPPSFTVPNPPAPPREAIAAGMREGARKMRGDASGLDANALRIERDRSAPPEVAEQAVLLRGQASDLRRQADDLDQQAADVLND